MSALDTLPIWLALPAAVLLVIGATLAFVGSLGFLRLRSFYERLHATTLGGSWGAAAVLLASIAIRSWLAGELVLQELVIGAFIMITAPATLLLIARAALHRDRSEGAPNVPPPVAAEDAH